MLEQALKQWARAHQHGSFIVDCRYSRPSVHFHIGGEGRLSLTHTPGRSIHQIGLQEIYDLLKLAKGEGRDINVPQVELRDAIKKIDTTRAHE